MSHGKGTLPRGHTNIMIRIAATTARVIATAIVVCCTISISLGHAKEPTSMWRSGCRLSA
jgi:hypothetical protein